MASKNKLDENAIYNADCFDVMQYINDKSIDLILCDLPYGTTTCKWDTPLDLKRLWEEYDRIIKPNGAIILFAAQPFTSALVMSNPKRLKYELIWNKGRGNSPGVAKYRPMPCHESILVFGYGKITYNPQFESGKPYVKKSVSAKKNDNNHKFGLKEITTQNNGYRHPLSIINISVSPTTNFHPTQKPIELLRYLIKTYSNEGEIVLDNCMGSGSTCVAAKQNNRLFCGFEKEKQYYDIALQRLKEVKFVESEQYERFDAREDERNI